MGNWKAWFVTAAVCLMTLLPAPAQAVQWMPLGESEEGLVSMDRDSLKLTQDERYLKVWEKVEWPMVSAQGIAGELRHQEYDLKEKKWRQLSVYALNTKGQKVTGSRKSGNGSLSGHDGPVYPGPVRMGLCPAERPLGLQQDSAQTG